jgi:hypothetical protein
LLWSRSGRPSFAFGRFPLVRLFRACLLILSASNAAEMSVLLTRTCSPFYSQVDWIRSANAGKDMGTNLPQFLSTE